MRHPKLPEIARRAAKRTTITIITTIITFRQAMKRGFRVAQRMRCEPILSAKTKCGRTRRCVET